MQERKGEAAAWKITTCSRRSSRSSPSLARHGPPTGGAGERSPAVPSASRVPLPHPVRGHLQPLSRPAAWAAARLPPDRGHPAASSAPRERRATLTRQARLRCFLPPLPWNLLLVVLGGGGGSPGSSGPWARGWLSQWLPSLRLSRQGPADEKKSLYASERSGQTLPGTYRGLRPGRGRASRAWGWVPASSRQTAHGQGNQGGSLSLGSRSKPLPDTVRTASPLPPNRTRGSLIPFLAPSPCTMETP